MESGPEAFEQVDGAGLRGPFARVVDAVLYAFVAAVWAVLLAATASWSSAAVLRGVPGSTVAAVGRVVSWVAVRVVVAGAGPPTSPGRRPG